MNIPISLSLLKNEFIEITGNEKQWQEIETIYTAENRHYHNLHHLYNMYSRLADCKTEIQNWRNIMISLAYHDIVYDVLQHDNEEKSAALMAERMHSVHLPETAINACSALILATQTHATSSDNDVNLFTDADLSILGTGDADYKQYTENIRKEYGVYPDELYYPGRLKVLEHFLSMEHIYKTEHFRNTLEEQAIINLRSEVAAIQLLS